LCRASAWILAASIPMRIYSTAQGQAHDHVNRIYRDSRGVLWICTDEGLSRFDGNHFVNYTVSSGLPHIHVNDMLETGAGEYWIATDGGLARFHPDGRLKRFVTSAPADLAEALRVNALADCTIEELGFFGQIQGAIRSLQTGDHAIVRLVHSPTSAESSTCPSLIEESVGMGSHPAPCVYVNNVFRNLAALYIDR
jgi:ligand-binding sensor domain-containing protein